MQLRGIFNQYSLRFICKLFGKSPQGWYHLHQHKDEKVMKQALILEKVRRIRAVLPRLGTIKLLHQLHQELQSEQLHIGRDSLFRLMRENNLLIKNRRRTVKTTNSIHRFKIWPDLVNRRSSTMAEEIWVSDITYIRCKSGFAYLSLVSDAYSRKIVGYNLSPNLKADSCMKALKMGLNARLYPKRPLIHHSDRGIQYCCDAYIQLLQQHQIHISMTQSGSPYDNAIAERINGILKTEFGLHETFGSLALAKKQVETAISKYNYLRPHFSCGLNTPQYKHAYVEPRTPKRNQEYLNYSQTKSGIPVTE